MSVTGLDRVREGLTAYLIERGIHAVTAWPEEGRKRHGRPVVAVSLEEVRSGSSGFQNYLGERYNPETRRWEELYGKKLNLTFGLHIYAGREDGAAGCAACFDALAGALSAGGPEWLRLGSLSCGQTSFDQDTGMFLCPVKLNASAWLYAAAQEDGGALLDFEVRGVWK